MVLVKLFLIYGSDMKKVLFTLLILGFSSSFAVAEPKRFGGWSKKQTYYNQMSNFGPYLEDSRHVQIPQWEHEDWYLEDWFTQEKGMDMVKGFYEADIFRDQFQDQKKDTVTSVKTLVVGPGFYHLSGFDKRRVVAVVDATYGVTQADKTASVVLEDWYTKRPIGVYNKYGLKLH